MEVIDQVARKCAPWITLLGAGLVALATALHPITIDPWNADLPIQFISDNRLYWMWDHALMAVAIMLWLGGLAAIFGLFRPAHPFSKVAIALFISSAAMWLITLAFELGSMPVSVEQLHVHHAEETAAHRSLAESLFAGALISGYLAMIPAWLGVAVGAQSKWGMLSGIVGLAGIIYTLIDPVLWVLIVTSAPPFTWTVITAWRCQRGSPG